MDGTTDGGIVADGAPVAAKGGRDWAQALMRYRQPIRARSLLELAYTLVPFAALTAAAIWAATWSLWLAAVISCVNGLFLVRVFAIQHDCGHGSFFASRAANTWLGRALGVLTVTPYDVWRHAHSVHHASTGNLDRRGVGDIDTRTLAEYRAMSPARRLLYRLYRHPAIVLLIFPTYVFVLENRLPVGFMTAGPMWWVSCMATNAGIAAICGLGIWAIGPMPFVAAYLPAIIVASTIGVWLFYIQHQFEDAFWEQEENWRLHDAALHGSSHYDLPRVLRWLTANIGIHHVHHLNSRIPFYRLTDVLRDHPDLVDVGRLTLRTSLDCLHLRLWDEETRKLVAPSTAGRG